VAAGLLTPVASAGVIAVMSIAILVNLKHGFWITGVSMAAALAGFVGAAFTYVVLRRRTQVARGAAL
jgi:membrane associated rhomboid family serine protease